MIASPDSGKRNTSRLSVSSARILVSCELTIAAVIVVSLVVPWYATTFTSYNFPHYGAKISADYYATPALSA